MNRLVGELKRAEVNYHDPQNWVRKSTMHISVHHFTLLLLAKKAKQKLQIPNFHNLAQRITHERNIYIYIMQTLMKIFSSEMIDSSQ